MRVFPFTQLDTVGSEFGYAEKYEGLWNSLDTILWDVRSTDSKANRKADSAIVQTIGTGWLAN